MALLLPNYPLPGVPNTVLPSTSVQCYCRAVCAGKGSIRYGVCLPHFIPPMAPSLRLPGFGLQASGFPISITSLSAFRTILDSPDFHLERMEANTIQFKVQYFGLTIILSTSAWFPQMCFPQSSPSELVKDFFLGGRNFLDLPILSPNHRCPESSSCASQPTKCLAIFARLSYLERSGEVAFDQRAGERYDLVAADGYGADNMGTAT